MSERYSIYFAGDIFDHKHLVGNALLASYIDRLSEGRYYCVMPQDHEQGVDRKVSIRNQDLRLVIESDLGLFNFDGADLDSGTVVEFMIAKHLDIPSVVFRSDFRSAGDQSEDGDNWNLMCSNYPRTETVRVNAMEVYRGARGDNLDKRIDSIYTTLATRLITALDAVRTRTPVCQSGTLMEDLYRLTTQFCGGGIEQLLDDPDWLSGLLASKRNKGLLR